MMHAMYWRNSEIKLLLEVTLQYKEEKSKQNIDWRSHTSTYHDIWKTFLQVYPVKRAEEGLMHFPHDVEKINKALIIYKLVEMRRRYQKSNISPRFWFISMTIWGEIERCDEDGEDRYVVVEEEKDDKVKVIIKDTKASLESESSDCSSTESEDYKDTKALSLLHTSNTEAPITAEKMTAMHWTNSEIKALLEITVHYKANKAKQKIDWRSHTSSYHDIWKAFLQVYPVKRAEEGLMHFPHDVEKINKARIIYKLTDMRRRFHKYDNPRFWLFSEGIWGKEEQYKGEEEDEDEEEDELSEEYEEDSDVVVEEEEDDEVKKDRKDTKAALESESSDWSFTESEDSKDTKAALESEYSDWSSTESEDCKDTKAALESESSDWSFTESEDETETFKPPSTRTLFEDDIYYAQLDLAWPRESAERSRKERVKKHTELLLDLLVRAGVRQKI